jgi:hypothetical protein
MPHSAFEEIRGWPGRNGARRIWVPHPLWVFKGAGFDFAFFAFRLAPARTVNPAPLPSNPQFSPFPAFYLTS